MSTDNYKQVLFNDGEGLDYNDLNDLQRYLESKIWDQILHNLIGNTTYTAFNGVDGRDLEFGGQDGTDHASNLCYCLTPGAAYLRQGSAKNKVQIAPGTLLQRIGTLTGSDPKLIAYTFAGTEEWTIASGHATLPRVDVLQMKLEYVDGDSQSRDFEDASTGIVTSTSMNCKRRVQCTLSVKTGTAAASPTIPDPDTGYVPVGFVLVGETWTSAGNYPSFGQLGNVASSGQVQVADLRMPIRVRAYRVDPTTFKKVTAWALSSSDHNVTSSNATNDLRILCPAGIGRVFGVSWTCYSSPSSPTLTLGLHTGSGTTFSSRVVVPPMTTTNNDGDRSTPYYLFTHSPSAGPTIQASSVNKINVPIWTSAEWVPIEKQRTLGDSIGGTTPITASSNTLALKLQSGQNATDVGHVTFFIAEGL